MYVQPWVQAVEERLRVLADRRLHTAAGDLSTLKVYRRGMWNDRMLIETVLSMLTPMIPLNKRSYQMVASVQARLAFTMAVFNLLVQWEGLPADEDGFVSLPIA